MLTKDLYQSKLEFVSNNLNLINKLDTMEDYIFKKHIIGV
jgi:hypothetical protein